MRQKQNAGSVFPGELGKGVGFFLGIVQIGAQQGIPGKIGQGQPAGVQKMQKRLAVVTNSILAVSELAGLAHIDLYVVGGSVGGNLPASLGTKANEDISRFKVDKAFIGVHSVSFEAGITAITDAQMQMKQAILKTTQKVIVLADSSRFGGGYFSVICPISSVFRIVTDSAVSDDIVRRAALRGVPLVKA